MANYYEKQKQKAQQRQTETKIISLLEAVQSHPHTTSELSQYGGARVLHDLERLGIVKKMTDATSPHRKAATIWWGANLPTAKVVEWLYGITVADDTDDDGSAELVSDAMDALSDGDDPPLACWNP